MSGPDLPPAGQGLSLLEVPKCVYTGGEGVGDGRTDGPYSTRGFMLEHQASLKVHPLSPVSLERMYFLPPVAMCVPGHPDKGTGDCALLGPHPVLREYLQLCFVSEGAARVRQGHRDPAPP